MADELAGKMVSIFTVVVVPGKALFWKGVAFGISLGSVLTSVLYWVFR